MYVAMYEKSRQTILDQKVTSRKCKRVTAPNTNWMGKDWFFEPTRDET